MGYVVLGAADDVDVDTLPYIDLPKDCTRIYLGPDIIKVNWSEDGRGY